MNTNGNRKGLSLYAFIGSSSEEEEITLAGICRNAGLSRGVCFDKRFNFARTSLLK